MIYIIRYKNVLGSKPVKNDAGLWSHTLALNIRAHKNDMHMYAQFSVFSMGVTVLQAFKTCSMHHCLHQTMPPKK